MDKYELVKPIEKFAPPETQEEWDCSGWIVDDKNISDIKKVMLALTINDDIVSQARKNNCDMIIAHHPLFEVPIEYKDIQMYCAHTNLDKAQGGTTDTLIEALNLDVKFFETDEFTRYLELQSKIDLKTLLKKVKKVSENARYVNSNRKKTILKIAVCAGSGSEFIKNAEQKNYDVFITGDIKYHTADSSNIILIDLGHFESEKPIVKKLAQIIKNNEVEIIYAKQNSPFNHI
ncbi:Nif3-like dinuclear metal center hexameric protein [bacterium]|nr:Nif3-like dinuclear metal center hexameric protein [bacterium]